MQFSMDPMLMMGLEAHFEPLLTRLKMDIPLKNPLYEEVYEKYAPVFNETKRYFSQMPLLKNILRLIIMNGLILPYICWRQLSGSVKVNV